MPGQGLATLAAETARRLRLADTERAAEAGRVIAEERLRIARELHDTVTHSMATITVQAGSALGQLRCSDRDASGSRAADSRGADPRGGQLVVFAYEYGLTGT